MNENLLWSLIIIFALPFLYLTLGYGNNVRDVEPKVEVSQAIDSSAYLYDPNNRIVDNTALRAH